jgi:cysteine-rich repeat protein
MSMRRVALVLYAIVLLAACLHVASEACDNGGICPADLQCVAPGGQKICVLVTCGNGRLDLDEVCDDGNNRSGDGCPADCEAPCGDGVLDPGEVCDDGGTVDGDGCAADCRSLDDLFTLSPSEVIFAGREGDPPPAGAIVRAQLSYRGDMVVFGFPPDIPQPTWLSIIEESSTADTATFKLEPVDTSIAGPLATRVRFVARHHSSSALDTFDLPVAYHVEPSALALQTTSTSVEFTAPSGGGAPLPRTVTLTFNGPGVAAIDAPSWVTVTGLSAPMTSPAVFSIAVNTTAFPSGTALAGDVVFATEQANVRRTVTVNVGYRLVASLPEVRFVAPYVGVAGRGGVVRVRGAGFSASGTANVTIGGIAAGAVRPDNDTQITTSYPPLGEGRYVVTLAPEGSALSRAELVIMAPSHFTYQAIEAPSRRGRIVYDAERQTIYGMNRLDQQIERFVYVDGRWSTASPWSVPLLADIALAPDGRSLFAVDQYAINEISLTDSVHLPVQRAIMPGDRGCGRVLTEAAATDSGKLVVISDFRGCSGSTTSYLYDALDHSIRGIAEIYNGQIAGSADGGRVYIGINGLSPPQRLVVFDSLSSTVFDSPLAVNVNYMTVSGDASRMIEANANVYDRSLTLIGRIPFNGIALASRDSRRAFMYALDRAGARLEIYDLTGPAPASGSYPLIRTVRLPDEANNPGDSIFAPLAMTTSSDDAVVFISGHRRLLVVPLD